jgi:hypothetical protein
MGIDTFIQLAKRHGIHLTEDDFQDETLDGMEPEEWLEAMTMD